MTELVDDDLAEFGTFDEAITGDMRDPYADMARQAAAHPVQCLGEDSGMPHEASQQVFIVYGYDEQRQVLADSRTYSSQQIMTFFGDVLGKHIMLGMDEPEHGRYRGLVSKAFLPKAMQDVEATIVQRVADELIDRFAGRGRANLVAEFTFPYPAQIIAYMLGLPAEDYPKFQRWSIELLAYVMNPERGLRASAALGEYLAPILAARRAEPRDDMMSRLAHAELEGERLSDEEIFSFLRLLLPAGVETTYRASGSMLLGVLQTPGLLDRVREDRALVPKVIEEALRWEAPLITLTRVVTRDTELAGMRIPKGSTVMPMLGHANRSDGRYPHPETFDIDREKPAPHLAFGYGVHGCLGRYLALAEMRVALNTLLDRLPNLRLAPEDADAHVRGGVFRSPSSLNVLFDPA